MPQRPALSHFHCSSAAWGAALVSRATPGVLLWAHYFEVHMRFVPFYCPSFTPETLAWAVTLPSCHVDQCDMSALQSSISVLSPLASLNTVSVSGSSLCLCQTNLHMRVAMQETELYYNHKPVIAASKMPA